MARKYQRRKKKGKGAKARRSANEKATGGGRSHHESAGEMKAESGEMAACENNSIEMAENKWR